MATFQRLWNARHSIEGALNDELRCLESQPIARDLWSHSAADKPCIGRLAEINKDREMRAAITIQSIRRAIVARRHTVICT